MFKDLVLKNRSYRGYDQNFTFTKELLMELVEYARLSPSSMNKQPFSYYLAYQKEVVEKIQPCTMWAGALDMELPHEGKTPTGFIIICQSTEEGAVTRFQKDVGIVAQTMLLAAAERELGGCMIGSFKAGALKEAINLTEPYEPLLVIALGKPDEEIVLTEAEKGADVKYYRDDKDVHYVPKKKLVDIILNEKEL